jgi:CheY-like chemotaxis protein
VEDSQPLRVLVAEDDPPIRILIETVLQRAGFDVTSVHDGAWAIAQIQARPFDVLLIDLMMVPTSGYSVLKYLQNNKPELLQRVVILTAAHGMILRSVQKFGVYDIIKKPFDLEELHECVKGAANQDGEAL